MQESSIEIVISQEKCREPFGQLKTNSQNVFERLELPVNVDQHTPGRLKSPHFKQGMLVERVAERYSIMSLK